MRALRAGDGVLEVEQRDGAAGREPFACDGDLVGVGVCSDAALSGSASARLGLVGGGGLEVREPCGGGWKRGRVVGAILGFVEDAFKTNIGVVGGVSGVTGSESGPRIRRAGRMYIPLS